jgi:AraC family transcriptional regulator
MHWAQRIFVFSRKFEGVNQMGESRKRHNVAKTVNHSVVWGKRRVDVNDCFSGTGASWQELGAGQPMLSIVTEEIGGRCEARVRLDSEFAEPRAKSCGHASFIPAGMQVWGYSPGVRRIREVRVYIQEEEIEALYEANEKSVLHSPHLMLHDERIQKFGHLLSEECKSRAPANALYADGLVVALMSAFLRATSKKSHEHQVGLTRVQLSAAIEFMQAHLDKNIKLSEVAAVAGLSSSQFARAFRRSTEYSPHQWHVEARLRHAQNLLINSNRPLAEIALATGFSEQSHFTRVFQSIHGTTPKQYRRSHGR